MDPNIIIELDNLTFENLDNVVNILIENPNECFKCIS